jgi:hypothetical protein
MAKHSSTPIEPKALTELPPDLSSVEKPPAPHPAPVPTLGRIVLVSTSGKLKAGIVAEVPEDGTHGDCAVYVLEPKAPARVIHVTYAGDGQAPSDETTWAWPPRA